MKVLVVIDMQNDFTTGVLGNEQTADVVERVAAKISDFRQSEPNSLIIATLDTHSADYLQTQEGRNLPVEHCIKDTRGWQLDPAVAAALGENFTTVEKGSFGSTDLPRVIAENGSPDEIQMIGVCTDICVISNAMILKAAFPEVPIRIIANCCAGVTQQSHENALSAMRACQFIIE